MGHKPVEKEPETDKCNKREFLRIEKQESTQIDKPQNTSPKRWKDKKMNELKQKQRKKMIKVVNK